MYYNKIIPYLDTIMNNPRLLSLQINLTNKCKSLCIYCRKYKWPQVSLDIEKVKQILKQVKKIGCESIALSGGEPLSYEYLEDVINELNKLDIQYVIFTSLITKNHRLLDLIAQTAEKIQVSLDAVEGKLYGKIRGVEEEIFSDIVVKNLSWLINCRPSYKETIKINTVVSKLNFNHLDKIKKFVSMLKLNHRIFGVNTWNSLKSDIYQGHTNLSPICIVYKIHAVIDADGSVYPCCRLLNDNGEYDYSKRYSYGNIYKENFIDLFNEVKINDKFYDAPTHIEFCKDCNRYYEINKQFYNYYLEIGGKSIFL